MNKAAKLFAIAMFLVASLIMSAAGDESGTAPAQSSIELGGFAGMLIFSDSTIQSLTTYGIMGGAYVRPGVEIGLAYNRAGISFLGVELMSINMLDAFLSVDLSPAERFGTLLRLGGSYLQANAFGEGIGGMLALAGVGFRVSPATMVDVFAQYTGRFRNALISTVEAGIRVRF